MMRDSERETPVLGGQVLRKLTMVALLLGLFGAAGLASAFEAATAPPELRVIGRNFVDAQDRVVILRGLNVAGNAKVPPFIPFRNLAMLDPLPGFGANVIRLLFNWEAYEPEPGQYDEDYLAWVSSAAAAAWARGLYVIIDLHQDGYSRFLAQGCGEGFPRWAIPWYIPLSLPDNGLACGSWGLRMSLDPLQHATWNGFYQDAFGVRSRFLALWQRLVRRFSQIRGVIGYDLLNEPWGWETSEIGPLYDDLARVIRREDPEAILFIEPHIAVGIGVAQTALPRPDFGNVAYAPHLYDPMVIALGRWDGKSTQVLDLALARAAAKSAEWNVPLIFGELGVSGTLSNGRAFMDAQYDRLNARFASAVQWAYTPGWNPETLDGWNFEDFSIVDNAQRLRRNFRIRPYAQKIFGEPLRMDEERAADGSTLAFTVSWRQPLGGAATEIFCPATTVFGAQRVGIHATGDGLACDYDPRVGAESDRVICRATGQGVMTVTLSAGDGSS